MLSAVACRDTGVTSALHTLMAGSPLYQDQTFHMHFEIFSFTKATKNYLIPKLFSKIG